LLFEPLLAASLLLRAGPTLAYRDTATLAAVAVRVALALASIVAAMGLWQRRPFAWSLAMGVLACSAAFAVLQYFTRALPTSLAPDVAWLLTIAIVVHHGAWLALLMRSRTGR
jgi:hypothetical protein